MEIPTYWKFGQRLSLGDSFLFSSTHSTSFFLEQFSRYRHHFLIRDAPDPWLLKLIPQTVLLSLTIPFESSPTHPSARHLGPSANMAFLKILLLILCFLTDGEGNSPFSGNVFQPGWKAISPTEHIQFELWRYEVKVQQPHLDEIPTQMDDISQGSSEEKWGPKEP